MIKQFYKDKAEEIINNINANRGDCVFAIVADSHLDNSLEDTINNIKMTDKGVNFDFLLHLGDFMNGNIPKNYTEEILNEQMEIFRNSIKNRQFFPTQGNHDGYVDDIKLHSTDIALDEMWVKVTDFTDTFSNAKRPGGKPYYYVDIDEKNLRIVSLCSFYYTIENNRFIKQYGVSKDQIEWLKEEALNVDSDKTVILISHDTPFGGFTTDDMENYRINGKLLLDTVVEAKKKNGFDIPAWFIGHFHGDYIKTVEGINFVVVASETAYVPQLWGTSDCGSFPKRELGTITEDLWDAAVLDKAKRELRLYRFGAGEDRLIKY